jgi:hypothetical protein
MVHDRVTKDLGRLHLQVFKLLLSSRLSDDIIYSVSIYRTCKVNDQAF